MFGKLKNLFGGDSGIEITAPVAGKVVALEDVPDPTFAQGILGPGIAIEPSEGRITAPADGSIDVMFETGHAVSMTTADGAELLIHVGIDTVQLEGKHYKACCKAGQQVKKGDVLIEFDPAAIKAEGYQIVTPILVCNPDAFTVEPAAEAASRTSPGIACGEGELLVSITNGSGKTVTGVRFNVGAYREGRSTNIAKGNWFDDDHIINPRGTVSACWKAPGLTRDPEGDRVVWKASIIKLEFAE